MTASARQGERISDPDVYRQGLAEIKERMSLPAFVAWGEGMIAALEQQGAALAAAEQDRDEARTILNTRESEIDEQGDELDAAVARAAELAKCLAMFEVHDYPTEREWRHLKKIVSGYLAEYADDDDGVFPALASSAPDQPESAP